MSKTYEQGREEVARLCQYFADNWEINRLIYELYGVTEKEIAIVEGGMAK